MKMAVREGVAASSLILLATLIVLALLALAIQSIVVFVAFFGPDLAYKVETAHSGSIDSDRFISLVSVLTDSQVHRNNKLEVLTNGECFYESELETIRHAEHTINLEAYIFHRGEIGRRFVEALAKRARAGVQVKLTIDFIGSFSTFKTFFKELTEAGGRVEWYHSARLDLIPRINNRTHRELLVVDGKIGFIGGAGIDDQWIRGTRREPRWRDTMIRFEGPAVASLQSTFAENWLRVSGEILTGEEYFTFSKGEGTSSGFIVNSTPAETSTPARVLFQILIASAEQSIYIGTPYFLPDRSARNAIVRAVRDRHVAVKILTPGRHADHGMTRASSRRLYGELLKQGVEIYEYQPTMIHAKILVVDGLWSVVGSTNFDYRSFDINDEVNLAVIDPAVADRLIQDFHHDLTQSVRITYEDWRKKARFRFYEWFESLLDRQE